MTREKAKVFMLQFNTDKRLNPSEHEAVRVAIQALSQEPCDDAVSREYLFKVLDDFCGHDRTATITLDTLADLVYDMPSVTQKSAKDYLDMADRKAKKIKDALIVTHKSGKWHIAHGMYEDRFWCSCGYIRIMDSRMNEWKYCPVCGGAKMVEPQERNGKE